jgi:transposase
LPAHEENNYTQIGRACQVKPPKPIEVDTEELSDLKERVASGELSEKDRDILQGVITSFIFLSKILAAKNATVKRLRKMLFGSKSEKASKVIPSSKKDSKKSDQDPPDDESGAAGASGAEVKKEKKRKGHGRKGADAYTGANRVKISHQTLRHADQCPECLKGKVYLQQNPGIIVHVRGSAPLPATIYELEKLRCNLCGAIFTAKAPEHVGREKYDDTAKAMMALLKYGAGMPFYRLENLQHSLGHPMASSTIWDQVEKGGDKIYPVYKELKKQGAQGDLVHNDDTSNKILDLIKENKTKADKERTGIFTTGIVCVSEGHSIAIFHTGRRHAGENLAALLEKRAAEKDPPIQMADALSHNVPKEFETILANCLAHARRKFVDVTWAFPDECRYVIEALGKVYKYDEIAKIEKLSAQQRLEYHQQYSKPVVDELKEWLDAQINQMLTEHNSNLGTAIKYMRKHWDKLTLFLSVAGAPLDNNLCERALKQVILNRKNSLFFKSQFGAFIGDMYMSLIHTCNLMHVNPFDYLVALQKYSAETVKNPSQWMPWNFKEAMAAVEI